ncbi:MAG: DUF5320 domain-containing protein [Bacteroidales bacterium]
MPGLDRTGPESEGPMTGRKLGRCANHENGRQGLKDDQADNIENLPPGKGAGRSLGRKGGGRGRKAGPGGGRGLGRKNRLRGGQ